MWSSAKWLACDNSSKSTNEEKFSRQCDLRKRDIGKVTVIELNVILGNLFKTDRYSEHKMVKKNRSRVEMNVGRRKRPD